MRFRGLDEFGRGGVGIQFGESLDSGLEASWGEGEGL